MALNIVIPIGIVIGCIIVAVAVILTDEDNYKDMDGDGGLV